ncbi:hypothetical protein TASIC1_0012026100 [Trichoderma asperellum]|uniref:Uncharacterized protein n=1 Tax=Trichoderma asperellum TaxID=101201 RepID=A0A6V8R8C5_TRIAP|nr:hypothetical protein TASIC1_0012026100 [Trichoderma asperellum]
MAELDMDVDLAAPMKFDEHVDEDLIDYDIDTTENHSHEQWSSHQDEHASGALEQVHPVEGIEGPDSRYTEAGQGPEASHPQGGMDYEHTDDAVEESHQQSEMYVATHQDKDTGLEAEQSKDFNEAGGNKNIGDIPVSEAEHAVDEIDYEDEDATVTQVSPKKPDDTDGGVHESNSNDDMAAAANVASTTTAELASLPLADAPVGSSEVPELATKEDEDEITWEHDDEGDAEKHDEQESAADAGETVAKFDHTETEPTHNSDLHDQVYEQHAHTTDSDYDADAAVEVSEEKTSPAYHQDHSLSQVEEQDSEAPDFPAITVQYKGDEFPFFSQDKTEGFFSDPSVLDHSMESVLIGLRSELENEIATQDELVFQVDELGLEFAEATAHNTLTTITLRQVLEVFDLLVKNQDPDSSRTLYTYLFTRSSASKRFEFLAESAAAGRGLDEVIHLFENPVGHHHVLAEAENEHGHYHGEDSDANEAAETHESAEDDDDENEENEDADADTEESEGSEEDEEEEEEDEEETSAAEEQPIESADQYEDEEEEAEEEEDEEDEDDGEDFMAEAEDFIRDAEENANQEGEYSDDVEESYEQLQAVVVEPVNHSGHADATAEADNAPDATYSYDDEDEDADANPFIHLEMQETMVDDGAEIEYESMAHAEVGNEGPQQLAMHPIDEYIDTNEADTGTTNTLADNGEGISTLLDMGADQGLEEITNEDLAFEDEMPEIDWRDDLDAPDDAKNEMPGTPSGLPKRRRTEDEQGVEDEQDAKRRRP